MRQRRRGKVLPGASSAVRELATRVGIELDAEEVEAITQRLLALMETVRRLPTSQCTEPMPTCRLTRDAAR